MTDSSANRLYVALIHHPVIDKNGATIASAITNLDLHDIARACRTYGVRGFYVITPLEDQLALVDQILDHWKRGQGAIYNPSRRQALEGIRPKATYDAAVDEITRREGWRPKTVATTARPRAERLTYAALRAKLRRPRPYVLAFGTAWGLADTFMDAADYTLAPVVGKGDYNHLSVRSAAAIILDRLLGDPDSSS